MLLDIIVLRSQSEVLSEVSKVGFLVNLQSLCMPGVNREQELKDLVHYLACIHEEGFLKRLVDEVVVPHPELIEKCLHQPFLTARQC